MFDVSKESKVSMHYSQEFLLILKDSRIRTMIIPSNAPRRVPKMQIDLRLGCTFSYITIGGSR